MFTTGHCSLRHREQGVSWLQDGEISQEYPRLAGSSERHSSESLW